MIPSGLLWFYPHDIFPGITSQGEPPLGHMILGASCLLSGEDFSRVSEIKPMFYPGREDLIGREMVAAQGFCQFPIFLFGLLFFLIISLFAFTILSKYSATFVTAFFAFHPFTLNFSRWIHVDIILWFFLALNLYFIYRFYTSEKYSKREMTFLVLSSVSLGLAGATKFSFGLFLLFDLFILAEKYIDEIKHLLKTTLNFNFHMEKTNTRRLIQLSLVFIITFSFFFLLPFQLNPKNVLSVYSTYKSHSPGEAGLSLSFNLPGFFVNNFLYSINLLDLLLFFISLYTLFYLIKNKKTNSEKFIIYYVGLVVISFFFFRALHLARIALPYLFSFVFLMALTFSEREYSILNFFRSKKRIVFLTFTIVYIVYSFSIAFASLPYFEYANPLICKISKNTCEPPLSPYVARDLGDLMNSIMKDDETFILQPAELFFYSRPEQGLEDWNFYLASVQQFGREPTLEEKIQFFRPNNRTVRYLIVDPIGGNAYQEKVDLINKAYEPNHKLTIKNKEIYWIYDLEELKEK